MSPEKQSESEKKSVAKVQAHPKERQSFKALLLGNENYFGNLKESAQQPVLSLAANTFYEELACVGYHPQQRSLEAVVYLYRPAGYGTDLCGAGTPEFVRFYLSFDGGATWVDQGVTSFQAHDIPGTDPERRLELAVSLPVNPPSKLCFLDPLIQVRAILSWNHLPPANQPNWTPVWGNARDAAIQVQPRFLISWVEAIADAGLKVAGPVAEIVDPESSLKIKHTDLGAGELARLYKGQVPAHRFAFKELAALTSGTAAASGPPPVSLLAGVVVDPATIAGLLPGAGPDGSTVYEELTCIGLDPNTPETMVGVLRLKRATGYSGGPCTSGSTEHVTFWADFAGDGSFSTCLGTANVQVYDLPSIPAAGIYYAVRLPVDLQQYRQGCGQPKVVRVRAILSWSVAVPCANPNQVPVWGNRLETFVDIPPGIAAPGGKIAILGSIPVPMIAGASGLTTAGARFATNNLAPDAYGRPCPFGARITVQGAPLAGQSYRVAVTPESGGGPTAVVTDLLLTRQDGSTWMHQADPTTGRFTYVPFTENIIGVLAQWDSVGDLRWTVTLNTFDGAGNPTGTDSHAIQLDNTAPEASIEITTGVGNCGKFQAGTPLAGKFVARDAYFGSYSLEIEPAVNAPGTAVPSPAAGIVPTAPAPGDDWQLATAGMRPCGYVIRVVAVDRAIVNSQAGGHPAADSAGFCVDPAPIPLK